MYYIILFRAYVMLCVSPGVQLWRHRWMFFQERHHLFTPMKRRVSESPVAAECSGWAGVRQTVTQLFVSLHGDKTQGLFLWHRDKRRLCWVSDMHLANKKKHHQLPCAFLSAFSGLRLRQFCVTCLSLHFVDCLSMTDVLLYSFIYSSFPFS